MSNPQSPQDAQAVWHLFDSSCVVCEQPLGRSHRLADGELPGRVILLTDSEGEQVRTLMCSMDAYAYSQRDSRGTVDVRRLIACRLEQLAVRRSWQSSPEAHGSARARCHVAKFQGIPEQMLFLKVTNESSSACVTLMQIEVAGEPDFLYNNGDDRPLPVSLRPREIFETWIELDEFKDLAGLEERIRVRLSNSEVVRGERNTCVPPFGVVGGPGRVSDKIDVRDPSSASTDPQWDVFVSYASEDFAEVVSPLKEELESLNIRVWIAPTEVKIGDSLRRRIDEGIRRSRFATVVLSPDYLRKGWTNWELDGIVSEVARGRQRLLPVLHRISEEDLVRYSPAIAGKLTRSTAQISMRDLAREIASVVQSHG